MYLAIQMIEPQTVNCFAVPLVRVGVRVANSFRNFPRKKSQLVRDQQTGSSAINSTVVSYSSRDNNGRKIDQKCTLPNFEYIQILPKHSRSQKPANYGRKHAECS
jgi:hypothetical protein